MISFLATPGNKCCHGNTFFSVSLTYISVDFLHAKPPHEEELVNFSAISGSWFCHGNTFFCFNIVDIKSPEEDLYGKVT